MKNLVKLVRFSFVPFLFLTSCMSDNSSKVAENSEKNELKKQKITTTELTWTAYKTSDQVPVEGTFKNIQLDGLKPDALPLEALEGVSFKIQVDGLDSKNPDRDEKIMKYFFGNLKFSNEITGILSKVNLEAKTIDVALVLNDITQLITMDYVENPDKIQLNGRVELKDFSALDALKELNKICFDLHKGEDGKSILWDFVDIKVSLNLQ